MNAPYSGGCRCGAVRFEASEEPLLVANCHCRHCRKATGAAVTSFVDFNRGAVMFHREPAIYASSPGAERLFCPNCGSPIAFRGEASAGEINIYIGAMDKPEDFNPSTDCHADSKLWP